MLAIRMQRTGRKGYAQFRVIIQDSHRSPSTGKVTAYLGSYDPHTKEAKLDKEKIDKYLSYGAQPSNRVAVLLKKEGYKLPKWVNIEKEAKKSLKNPEKLRKNRPAESKKDDKPQPTEESDETTEDKADAESASEPKESTKPEPAEDQPKEDAEEKKPDEDKKETATETKSDKAEAKTSEQKESK